MLCIYLGCTIVIHVVTRSVKDWYSVLGEVFVELLLSGSFCFKCLVLYTVINTCSLSPPTLRVWARSSQSSPNSCLYTINDPCYMHRQFYQEYCTLGIISFRPTISPPSWATVYVPRPYCCTDLYKTWQMTLAWSQYIQACMHWSTYTRERLIYNHEPWNWLV